MRILSQPLGPNLVSKTVKEEKTVEVKGIGKAKAYGECLVHWFLVPSVDL